MTIVFALIAMTPITNTTLVSVVTQSRILYGMAREDVVPAVFAKVHPHPSQPVSSGSASPTWSWRAADPRDPAQQGRGRHRRRRAARDRHRRVPAVHLRARHHLGPEAARTGRDDETYRANTALLVIGLVGNIVLLGYVVYDDPASLSWSPGSSPSGVALYLVESFFGSRDRPRGVERGDPAAATTDKEV